MFSLLTFLFGFIINFGKSKKELLLQISLLQKEIQILKRRHGKKRIKFHHSDRIIIAILKRIGNSKEHLSLVKPETVLRWQRQLIKHFWTFKSKKRVGRPPVSNEIKQLILAMKNDNLYWGSKKIQGELKKLDIQLDKKTIRNILNEFRRKGKVKPITRNPCRQFVRQHLIEFEQTLNDVVYLIHDNAAQFNLVKENADEKIAKSSIEFEQFYFPFSLHFFLPQTILFSQYLI
jgi:transposase